MKKLLLIVGVLLCLSAMVFSAAPVSAQSVRGHILDAETGLAVKGGFVRLVDSAGVRIAETMTDSAGLFHLQARTAGTYFVRVERLGYATFKSDAFLLDRAITHDFKLPATAIVLPAVTSQRDTRCEKHKPMDPGAALIWEEVRKGLNATSWTAQNVAVFFQILNRTQYFDANLRPTGAETKDITTDLIKGTPFSASSKDSLLTKGFVHKSPETYSVYYGPDAEMIMSDMFQQTHCFHATTDRRKPELIGLAFEPDGEIKPVDIRGTLWLDRKTHRLTHLEFSYDDLPVDAPRGSTGGVVTFAQLDNGLSIVSSWKISVPVVRDGRTPKDERGAFAGIQERSQSVISAYVDDKVIYRALTEGGGK